MIESDVIDRLATNGIHVYNIILYYVSLVDHDVIIMFDIFYFIRSMCLLYYSIISSLVVVMFNDIIYG